jgi:hypothetical protein
MSDVNEILVALPEIAMGAGYFGGLVVDHLVGRSGEAKRTEAIHTQGVAPEEYQDYLGVNTRGQAALQPPVPVEETSRASQRFDRFTRPVALAMSLSALMLAMNFHTAPPHRETNPILEIDVDHPWNAIGNGSITPINAMATAFEHAGRLQVTAEVAEDDIAKPTTLANLAGDEPNDATSLPLAVSQSVDSAMTSIHTTHGLKPNAGILVITDDDPLGGSNSSVESVVTEAGGLPISIVNEGSGSDQTAQDLMAIAKATHGHYYGAQTQPAAVVSAMKNAIQPKAEAAPAPQENSLLLAFATLLSVIVTAKLIARRAELQWRGKLRPSKGL